MMFSRFCQNCVHVWCFHGVIGVLLIVAVFSDLCISRGWGDPEAPSRERDLQFGTNLLVFAMAERAAGTPMLSR